MAKRGRPPKPAHLRADKCFYMRISTHNLDILRWAARNKHVSMAKMMLIALDEYVERHKHEWW